MRKSSPQLLGFPRAIVVASQLLIFAIICGLLYWAQFILVPVSLAILCAFVLYPGVRFLERRKLKRAPAVVLVMAVALGVVGSLAWTFGTQLNGLVKQLPEYRENIKEKIAGVRGMTSDNTISNLQKTIREVGEELDREEGELEDKGASAEPAESAASPAATPKVKIEEAVPVKVVADKQLFDVSLAEVGPYLNLAFKVALMIILTGLFLYWREDLVERLVGLAGQARMVVTTNALTDAGSRISRFLGLQFAVNVAYGVVASLGLYFLDVPYAVVWGGFAGILRYIPYVGSILGTLSASTAALVTLPGWQPVLYVFLFFTTMDILVNICEPFIFGPGLGVSVLAVLLSVVVLGWLWGPVGAILATPFALCLVVLGEYVPGLSFLAWLMSQNPRLEPHSNFYHRLLRHDFEGAAQILKSTREKENSDNSAIAKIVVPTLEQVAEDQRNGTLASTDVDWIGEAIADIIEDLDREPLPPRHSSDATCQLLVCPPVSSLDEAAMEALAWIQSEVPAQIRFSDRGRLVSEIIANLREEPVQALVLLTSHRDEKRQTRRWRRHLDEAGLDIPIILFSWSENANPLHNDTALKKCGATVALRGWDRLLSWVGQEGRKKSAPDSSTNPIKVEADQTVLDTTVGEDKPRGERGASVADTIGRAKTPERSWFSPPDAPARSSSE